MRRSRSLLISLALLAGLTPAFGAAAPKPTPKPAASATPPTLKLKWSTASEVDNYGFFVMRGDSQDGPFKQLNAKAVPGAGNADTPTKYEYEDKAVQDGKTYYYYLDSISTQGVREKFSPILAKVCCARPESARVVEPSAPAAPPQGNPVASPPAGPPPTPGPSPSANP